MKKSLSIVLLSCILNLGAWGQDTTNKAGYDPAISDSVLRVEMVELNKQINYLQREVRAVTNLLTSLQAGQQIQSDSLTLLQSQLEKGARNTQQIAGELGIRIESNAKNADKKFNNLGNTISKKSQFWIISSLLLALLSGLIYFLLRKKGRQDSENLSEKIGATRKKLEEEGILLDKNLVDLMDTQLRLIDDERQIAAQRNKPQEVDHSLALKVADEIIRIEKNISRMDSDTKGLKQLNKSLERIKDNFAANGYEIVEMLNKSYHEGMKVSANFIADPDLEDDQQIITRVIKPQVNFGGKMIQTAHIEVSQSA